VKSSPAELDHPETETRAAYDAWAASYDTAPNRTRDLDAQVLRLQTALALEGADVLEVGCGTGKNTEWLAVQARSVLALDFSSGMLEKARLRVRSERVRFVEHDLREPWPVAPSSMDAVVTNLVLEHVEHLEPFFRRAAYVLRPGGRVFVCELHPFRQWSGSQARFAPSENTPEQLVPAYRHDVSHYLNAGVSAGLRFVHCDEWLEDSAPAGALPRLFSTLWVR
jgi:ubiquinone/menaquinone biosynthesis C-methylase UbiE